MKLLHRIAEDEVIAEFLKAEIHSKRFGEAIKRALGDVDARMITHPDLLDREENLFRKRLLGEVRGYGHNKDLFEDFPSEVQWNKAIVTREDLKSVMYIDYSYWNELSSHSRLPVDAARNILSGVEIFNVSNDGFKEIFSEIKRGTTFPKLIFVSCNEYSKIVLLEGHARLTAYFLDMSFIPAELEVMIGYSEDFLSWGLY